MVASSIISKPELDSILLKDVRECKVDTYSMDIALNGAITKFESFKELCDVVNTVQYVVFGSTYSAFDDEYLVEKVSFVSPNSWNCLISKVS